MMRKWLEANAPASLRGMGNDPLHGVWGGKRFKFPSEDARLWLERAAGLYAAVVWRRPAVITEREIVLAERAPE